MSDDEHVAVEGVAVAADAVVAGDDDDPCSVPDWLRLAIPMETARQKAGCRRHDARYKTGGDRRRRLVSDLVFPLDLMGASPELLQRIVDEISEAGPEGSMDADNAERYLWGVRMYGWLPTHWPGGDAPGAFIMPPDPVPVQAP